MMSAIVGWAGSHPDEKVLVISQWTSCLQLVSTYLAENEINHVKCVVQVCLRVQHPLIRFC